ncbi:t-SNARE complex subunit [Encephalitozoon cuniculi EcunIII-L]|uniref:Protein of the syntaxin/epimorphin family n=1 Tax=Encephalitozoon cuniculi TaxID=6035 RepID=M1K2E3_ENCCN|nr:protein of the syntaxin/epimorphin family [Encephalitozoon cuniculi]KMV65114.1 t-SNARE complex subunit [Encephalitozoon cuniculi EcunIII-L]UYI26363.1 syntaxin [Encephalitozoon cuniculi]
MQDFLKDSKRILNDIETLNSYTNSIDYLSSQKNSSVLSKEEEQGLNRQIDVLNERFRTLSRKIKERIDNFSEETANLERNSKKDRFYHETRKIHLHAQSKKLTEAINRYRESQIKHREDEVDKFRLQYIIAKPDATEKEIEEFIGDDDGTKVASAYALGAHSAQGILKEAENRKKNIKKIEEMVQDIVDLLNLISQEVSKRTEVVEAINDQLITGEENTAAANADLESALAYQIRATRIKRIFVYGILIIAIIFIMYFVFKTNFFGAFDRIHYY